MMQSCPLAKWKKAGRRDVGFSEQPFKGRIGNPQHCSLIETIQARLQLRLPTMRGLTGMFRVLLIEPLSLRVPEGTNRKERAAKQADHAVK
jgi:hypothetical protein